MDFSDFSVKVRVSILLLTLLYWTHYLFSDWLKAYSEFSKSAPVHNHGMYDWAAWFLRVIMSSLCTLCFLPSVKKQKHKIHFFSFNV